jgi:hypothetical protein
VLRCTSAEHSGNLITHPLHVCTCYSCTGTTNWDEFTSFCVQTGLSVNTNKNNDNKNFSLEQYVIEYAEAHLERDHTLSAYRFISLMRYVPENRKILVISEDVYNVFFFVV